MESSVLFDRAWYLAQYPDVAESGIDPVEHYLRWGVAEGRSPGPEFDAGERSGAEAKILCEKEAILGWNLTLDPVPNSRRARPQRGRGRANCDSSCGGKWVCPNNATVLPRSQAGQWWLWLRAQVAGSEGTLEVAEAPG